MRSSLLVPFILAGAIGVSCASTASAGGCNGAATASVNSGFVVPEIAFTATKDPVSQDVLALTCGDFTYSIIPTTELSSTGTYGNRGYGDEIDLSMAYDHSLKTTPIGPVDMEVGEIFQKFAPFKSADGTLVLYDDFARPFQLNDVVKVSPFIRIVKWVGTGSIPSDFFVRPGLRGSATLSSEISFSVEVSRVLHFEGPVHNGTYSNIALTRDLGHKWSASLTAQFTERAPSIFGVSFTKNW
jgi:hypothetical protein